MQIELNADQKSKIFDFLQNMKDDAWSIHCSEDRLIDNSCCTSASYYTEARAANDKEYEDRIAAIEEISIILGFEG